MTAEVKHYRSTEVIRAYQVENDGDTVVLSSGPTTGKAGEYVVIRGEGDNVATTKMDEDAFNAAYAEADASEVPDDADDADSDSEDTSDGSEDESTDGDLSDAEVSDADLPDEDDDAHNG